MSGKIELQGKTFGSWTVLRYADGGYWTCRCSCGLEKNVCGRTLRHGLSSACVSCARRKTNGARTHAGYGTRLYRIWSGMRRRCLCKTNVAYPDYGGSGIQICEAWASFEIFRKWALENGYAADLTLDRRDNDGGYSPENCRWATYQQQNRNQSSTKVVTFRGERVPAIDLAERIGIKPHTLRQRIFRMGWSVEKVVSTPVSRRSSCPINLS